MLAGAWLAVLLPAAAMLPVVAMLPTMARAEVSVDRLFPPAVQAGQPSVITAEGKFSQWPAEVWCDRDDVTITPAEESGKWNVAVAADATSGVAWLRFYDGDSATAPLPLLIETVAIVPEAEPNNLPTQATAAELPSACVGRLDKAGEVDCFVVTAQAGQTLVASVIANRVLGSPMDGVLQITDLQGNVLAQNDDARGYDPQIAYLVPRDGQYCLRLFAFPTAPNQTIGFSGAASYVYRLLVTTGPMINHALPLVAQANSNAGNAVDSEANGETGSATEGAAAGGQSALPVGWNLPEDLPLNRSAATAISPPVISSPAAVGWEIQPPLVAAGPLASRIQQLAPPEAASDSADAVTVEVDRLPALVSGRLHGPHSQLRANLSVAAGTAYRAIVYSQTSDLKVDSVITVTDRDSSKQLARNDDQPAALRDAAVDFAAESDGEMANVEVRVEDLVGGHGPTHDFTLAIYPRQPSLTLTVPATQYKLAAGDSLEIAVTINRRDGLDQDLVISVEGLPESITAAAITSVAKEDSGKAVTLKLEASGELVAAHQTFRIVARPVVDGDDQAADPAVTATATAAVGQRFSLQDLWLTTVAAP